MLELLLYIVLRHIKYDHKHYYEGSEIELDPKSDIAIHLLSTGSIRRPGDSGEPDNDPPTIEDIVDAIVSLDFDNTELFTASKKPKVEVIEELLGKDITAGQRDEAWEIANKDPESATIDEIISAISKLDGDNEALFVDDVPTIEAVTTALGKSVTVEEVATAWAQMLETVKNAG
jgi:hypothetical protein